MTFQINNFELDSSEEKGGGKKFEWKEKRTEIKEKEEEQTDTHVHFQAESDHPFYQIHASLLKYENHKKGRYGA